ncbi:hypothetical protein V8G54_023640 [Vigna mungo]|uniref:Uncharacterized protein n=1 Tax=Vigna mungo TaxID=3915 RepID=A0AAQ3N4I3_VIGMU
MPDLGVGVLFAGTSPIPPVRRMSGQNLKITERSRVKETEPSKSRKSEKFNQSERQKTRKSAISRTSGAMPENQCTLVLDPNDCNNAACHSDCLEQYHGSGHCWLGPELTKDGHANEGLTCGNPFFHPKIRVSDLHLQIGEKLAPRGTILTVEDDCVIWLWRLMMMLVALHRCGTNRDSCLKENFGFVGFDLLCFRSFTTALLKGAGNLRFNFAMLVAKRLEQRHDHLVRVSKCLIMEVRRWWLAMSVVEAVMVRWWLGFQCQGKLGFLEVGDDDDVSKLFQEEVKQCQKNCVYKDCEEQYDGAGDCVDIYPHKCVCAYACPR